jgi:hypothetical protein
MHVPGFAVSQFIFNKANLILDEIWKYRYGIASRELTRSLLMTRLYTETMPSDVKKKLLEQAGYVSDPHSTRRMENIFNLNKPNKAFHPSQGEAFLATLRLNHYPEDVIKQLYEYITTRIIMLKYDIQLPIKPPFLKGPPGTGKTRLASLVASSFDIPLFKVNWNRAIDELFFIDTSLMNLMRDMETFPILMLFDEMDKSEHTNSSEVYNLLNNEPFSCGGLACLDFPTQRVFILCAGNELPRAPKVKNPEVAEAIMDRFNVIEFQPVTLEKKRMIQHTYIQDYCTRFGLDPTEIRVEEKEGGLRETLHQTGMEIIRHLRIRDGWNHIQ